jgi:hypothetical protein
MPMTTGAHGHRVQRWVDLPVSPDTVWAEIGGFGALAEWHPAISACEIVEIGGETHRHLTLADGEMILEKLTGTGPRLYRYEMVETPLPVANYHGTFTVAAEPAGARVFWSSVFDAEDPGVVALIGEVYELGLEALRDRYGG